MGFHRKVLKAETAPLHKPHTLDIGNEIVVAQPRKPYVGTEMRHRDMVRVERITTRFRQHIVAHLRRTEQHRVYPQIKCRGRFRRVFGLKRIYNRLDIERRPGRSLLQVRIHACQLHVINRHRVVRHKAPQSHART